MRITYCENYVNVICVLILYFLYATLTTKSLIYSIFPIEAVIKMFLQLSLSDVSLTGRYCAFCTVCIQVQHVNRYMPGIAGTSVLCKGI
jgi:hypothetical protein